MAKTAKAKTAASGFVPEGYEEKASGASRYLKFETGETKFRFLSPPIAGWLEWVDKVPTRYESEPEEQNGDEPAKQFWAAKVYDYSDKAVKIVEITQSTIRKALTALAKDSDWGSPLEYDVKVTRVGEGKKTKYSVNPSPKKPLAKEVIAADKETSCDLSVLFEGGDPWEA